MEPISIVQLNKKTRICAYYDETPIDPRDWNDVVSIHPIRTSGRYHGPNAGDDTHGDAITAIYEYNDNYEPELKKHFDRAGTVFQVVDLNADRDWIGTFVFYIEPDKIGEIGNGHEQEYLTATIKEYRQYSAGEVYTVAVEKLETWKNSRGDKREEWELSDSIGGIYDDVFNPETLLKIARVFFGVKGSNKIAYCNMEV